VKFINLKEHQQSLLVVPEITNQHIPWWTAPRDLQEGSIWIFDFIDDPTTKEKMVVSSRPLIEVVDLRMDEKNNPLDTIKELRSVKLPYVPSACVYLWLKEDMWCGPVVLTKDVRHKGQWIVNKPLNDSYIPLVRFLHDDLVSLPLLPGRLFVSPWYEAVQSFSFVDVRTFELIYADNTPLEVLMDIKVTGVLTDSFGKINSTLISPLVKQGNVKDSNAKAESVTTDFVKDIFERNESIQDREQEYEEPKKIEKNAIKMVKKGRNKATSGIDRSERYRKLTEEFLAIQKFRHGSNPDDSFE
jgi:hypothetical protein